MPAHNFIAQKPVLRDEVGAREPRAPISIQASFRRHPQHSECSDSRYQHRGALLCAAPLEARLPAARANATELPSCAHISVRAAQMHKEGGGGGGCVARRRHAPGPRRPSPAPRPEPHPPQRSGTSFAASFTCSSFTCRPRAARGATCVCWAWIPPLEDSAFHDEHLHAPVLRGSQNVLRHALPHPPRAHSSRVT